MDYNYHNRHTRMLLRLIFLFSALALLVVAGAFYVVERQEALSRRLKEITENTPVAVTPAESAYPVAEQQTVQYALPEVTEPLTLPQNTEEGTYHVEAQAPEDLVRTRDAAGMTDAVLTQIRAENTDNYYYAQLSDAEQTLYAELLYIMTSLSSDVYISASDTDMLDKVQNCVMNDHPEIFYISGYYSTRYTLGDTTVGFSFTGRYLYDAAEIARRQTQIEQYVNTCIASAPQGTDDYHKVKYIYDYLIDRTAYNTGAPDNQNICSVMIGRESVCQGYAKAAQLLLNRLGVRTTLVVGTVHTEQTNGSHAWNLVRADGNWYYLDVTWGDASFQDGADVSDGKSYDYLLTTGADMASTHTASTIVALPVCDHMEDNYYVREGAYFTSASLDAFGALVDRRRAEGASTVTFKCATTEIFQEMMRLLIDESKIFTYIPKAPGETLSFSRSDAGRSFTVWF